MMKSLCELMVTEGEVDFHQPRAALTELCALIVHATARMDEIEPEYEHFIFVRIPLGE